MNEAFSVIKDYDMIFFTPTDEEDETQVMAATYKDPGEKLDPGIAGDTFHIILFRLSKDYDIIDLEKFEGVLVDAKVYVERMVKSDWFGLVARKTTTSSDVVEETFAKWATF